MVLDAGALVGTGVINILLKLGIALGLLVSLQRTER